MWSSVKSVNADITTEEGKQQAQSGSSALSRYMQEMHDYQKGAIERLYTNTIDRPCAGACETGDEVDFFMVSIISKRER
jgi:hypothetical protein